MERFTILPKTIEDKKFHYPIESRNRELVLYQSNILNEKAKTESLFYIKSQRKVLISRNKKTYNPIKD